MFAAAVILLAWTTLAPGLLRRLVTVLAVLVALVIGLDRIFLGVHFLSDVVGGLLLGVMLTLTAWWLVLAAGRRRERKGDGP